MLCSMRAMCVCVIRIEVDVEMDSGVFKIDPIESAYVFYDMYTVYSDVCIWPHVHCTGQQWRVRDYFCAWTARGRRREMDAERQSFHFWEKYQEKVDAYENEKLKTENAPLLQTIEMEKKGKRRDEQARALLISNVRSKSQWKWNELNVRSIHACMWVRVSLFHTWWYVTSYVCACGGNVDGRC